MSKQPDLPPWSWIVSLIGLLFVGGSIGYMVYKSTSKDVTPPDIVIEHEQVVPRTESYLVKLRITNKGGSAASGLAIQGSLMENDKTIEISTTILEYAPSASSRSAALLFTRDPRRYRFTVRAVGYEDP